MTQVIKRDENVQRFNETKIYKRLKLLSTDLSPLINCNKIIDKVKEGIYNKVKTFDLEELLQQTCAYLACDHPDYALLGGRLVSTDLWKKTPYKFSEAMNFLNNNIDVILKEKAPLISDKICDIIKNNSEKLDKVIVRERDLDIDYFGMLTLKKSYLKKSDNFIIETPQYMFMRVALGIHGNDIDSVIETYNCLSKGMFIHATPSLMNAGLKKPQMSSCFLLTMKEDSIKGIYVTLKDSAEISKYSGGIGLSVHKIRATDSYIKGTDGKSDGIVPMLRVFDSTARYVNQGGGKRKGSFAIYLEPWHADIYEFLDLRKNHGKEEMRARDLFYALWISDLFMRRVENNGEWSLFCPKEAPGLADVWGEKFEKLYTKYENKKGLARKVVKARHLWFAILDAQTETGTPYILYKDAVNRKSNQQNLGTIRSSNLCCEIMEYTAPDEVAVCNLASMALPKYIINGKFNHNEFFKHVEIVTKNLNKIIDINFYPLKEAEKSNKRHRPIGIGVQGLSDIFALLKLPWGSKGSLQLNKEIFETMYYAALNTSCELSKINGPYETFKDSPISKGIFQFDMWGKKPYTDRWDWNGLKKRIMKHGIRNSLLIALMPTASTSQILGNTECIEPVTSNIYVRRVLSGEFPVINKHLVRELESRNLWESKIINKIISQKGSIQNINEIPKEIRELFKNVWEIPQRILVDMSADRGIFIDQSESANRFLSDPTIDKLTSMHFYSWKKGLKTGLYYLRSQPKADAIQFTVDKESLKETINIPKKKKIRICTDEICISCGS